MIERECAHCGHPFVVRFPSQEKRYCDRDCYSQSRKGQRKPIEHGTRAGAQAHYKRGEKPCNECRDAANAAYQERAHVYQANVRAARRDDPDRFKTYGKRAYWKDPEKRRQERRNYVARNRDAVNEKKRLDRVANADQVSARVAQWRDANPSMVEAKERKRRERQRIATERANRNFTRWTPEEDELVLTWVGGDLELAFALGRGYHSIASRRHNLRKCGQISTSTNHKEN